MNLVLILGNQLFDPKLLKKHFPKDTPFSCFIREDRELCTYYQFHKQKIIFFLAAMRTYRDELLATGIEVHYQELVQGNKKHLSFEESLKKHIKANDIKKVFLYEVEDKFFEKRLTDFFEQEAIPFQLWPSTMFLTSREQFKTYLGKSRRPFMKTFYEGQRKRLKILIDKKEDPVGGQWSFDSENRKALPKTLTPPDLGKIKPSSVVLEVTELCEKEFADHPGDASPFWLPVDRAGAKEWLKKFTKERLSQFGPYEDAIPPHSVFLFHSVLTPFLNTGLLTPSEVISAVLKEAEHQDIELSSLEGFVRQIIGWREFIRGIYQNFSEQQESTNFWKHNKLLTDVWYNGETGIPPLDRALKRVQQHGYLHHIERLMVIGSLMLLLEVDPKEVHRWFMEMFIDSSDWVMGPNVYGMAIFSDGGIFATKPYICGSNYYRKMGGDAKGDWCDGVDGLYWGFIEKHQKFFLKNPRLSMMARAVEKIKPERMKILKAAADDLRALLVKNP
jgi:deoxyribodipyrimidine photolyase-related protein